MHFVRILCVWCALALAGCGGGGGGGDAGSADGRDSTALNESDSGSGPIASRDLAGTPRSNPATIGALETL